MMTAIQNPLQQSPAVSDSSERILLILVAGIGDFVMATPAIRAIAHGFSGARITLLTTPQAADLARACPYLDETQVFDLRAYRPGERGLGWRAWRRFLEVTADLAARRFCLAVDLYAVASWMGAVRLALLLSRLKAGRTAGRWSRGKGLIFRLRSADRLHETDAMLALAEALGCPADDPVPELWIPEAARLSAAGRLSLIGISPSTPYAVLQMGSNKPEARLPAEKAAEIARRIRERLGLAVVLTGGKDEASMIEGTCRRIGAGSHNLAGATDLLALAAILGGAQVVVATDSGPMHMAVAAGAPTVALFGAGDPLRFGPRGFPDQIAILQSRTRFRARDRWHTDLTADAVVEAMRGLVRGRRVGADMK